MVILSIPINAILGFMFIIKEGMLSDCAYIIESGRVEVSKQINGERQSIGVLKEGDIFGEMGLIDGLPRSASVISLEDSSISIIIPAFSRIFS